MVVIILDGDRYFVTQWLPSSAPHAVRCDLGSVLSRPNRSPRGGRGLCSPLAPPPREMLKLVKQICLASNRPWRLPARSPPSPGEQTLVVGFQPGCASFVARFLPPSYWSESSGKRLTGQLSGDSASSAASSWSSISSSNSPSSCCASSIRACSAASSRFFSRSICPRRR